MTPQLIPGNFEHSLFDYSPESNPILVDGSFSGSNHTTPSNSTQFTHGDPIISYNAFTMPMVSRSGSFTDLECGTGSWVPDYVGVQDVSMADTSLEQHLLSDFMNNPLMATHPQAAVERTSYVNTTGQDLSFDI
jgi:hypothetical protein